jgi:hypothetical protein
LHSLKYVLELASSHRSVHDPEETLKDTQKSGCHKESKFELVALAENRVACGNEAKRGEQRQQNLNHPC